jgi:3-methylfumaryl-CoA hydratase
MKVDLETWVGRTEAREDRVTIPPMAALSATLDRDDPLPQPGDAVPPLWHWLWFLPLDRQSDLGPEGHREKGGFLPPVALPRRMWAGGRLEFHRPLRVGEPITRRSRIAAVREKTGRTGPLVFVEVHHEIRNPSGLAVMEVQDIVYREYQRRDAPPRDSREAPVDPAWERTIEPDDILLFRYSALTFNSHRIHYDRRYATEVEGYPGLVVHGPLIATLLVDLLDRHSDPSRMVRFRFRAVSPLFDGTRFRVCGRPEADGKQVALWAAGEGNRLAMTATAELQ